MAPLDPDSPVQYVKGVGPRRAGALARLGVRTVRELLEYFPFRYEHDLGYIPISELKVGAHATVSGEVMRLKLPRPGWPHVYAELNDGSGVCGLRWFNQPHAGKNMARGCTVLASGEVREFDGGRELIQPSITVFPPRTAAATGPVNPRMRGVYHASPEIQSNTIRAIIESVVATAALPIVDVLPAGLMQRRELVSRQQALVQIHVPSSPDQAEQARRRLAYEELLLLELGMALRRQKILSGQVARRVPVSARLDERIRRRFPFALTAAQDRVVREIATDLAGGRPMTRLLQGDVGSGKTVVALYACLAAIANGCQAAIMAPTEILAQQHFERVERYLAGSRVCTTLLAGAMPAARRKEALGKIAAGEIDLVVGTQALIQESVGFKDLALIVVDEQHKFGVEQRASFRTKGRMPHYLAMTATPIPRTLAMTFFGDLDVSVIDQLPPGRGAVVTQIVTRSQAPAMLHHLRRLLESGRQAYVVCPAIGGLDDTAPSARGEPASRQRSALQVHAALSRGAWKGLPIGLLHGQLSSDEKAAVLRQFARGDLRALVATTVVEVGVDVPNATLMVVQDANLFGLSQLHQLRGRIARSAADALCVLIADASVGAAAERLRVLTETTDGFRIAEADLRQRGPGELLGTRQHGLPELRVANLAEDLPLLELARRDAFELVARPSKSPDAVSAGLLSEMRRLFGDKLALIDAA